MTRKQQKPEAVWAQLDEGRWVLRVYGASAGGHGWTTTIAFVEKVWGKWKWHVDLSSSMLPLSNADRVHCISGGFTQTREEAFWEVYDTLGSMERPPFVIPPNPTKPEPKQQLRPLDLSKSCARAARLLQQKRQRKS